MHHFEIYQRLPIIGARAVEQFSIDGSLFLALAKFRSDIKGYIYKLNNSIGKFSLYQTIYTTAGRDIEHFTIAGKHYLAVANFLAGGARGFLPIELYHLSVEWNPVCRFPKHSTGRSNYNPGQKSLRHPANTRPKLDICEKCLA